MSDGITDEMVEVAAKAMWLHWPPSDRPIEVVRNEVWQAARAALEAALPLIVGGEREFCAAIADARAAENLRNAEDCPSIEKVYGSAALEGQVIARLIRARSCEAAASHSPTDPEKTE